MKKIIKYGLYVLILSVYLNNTAFPQNMRFQNQVRLAKTFEARGQLGEAEKIYFVLHQKEPKNYQFYTSLFNVLVKQKKYDDALELVENQIPISKSKVGLYGDLGSVYFLLGQEEKADQIWDEALELEPNNAFSFRTIANYLIENRDLEKAIDVLKQGNEVADDKTIFSYDIANLYSITMKYGKATKEYCKILGQKQKQYRLIQSKIIGYINANKASIPTIDAVKEIYEEEEKIIYLKLLADLYSKTSQNQKALETTLEIENKTTKNGSTVFTFAQQASRFKNYRISALAYKEIIDNYPNSALFAEAEIGYTRSLEADLNEISLTHMSWKPLTINDNENKTEYFNLLNGYQKLVLKYPNNKVGHEAEFRIGKIYCDIMGDYKKADSIYNKIIIESKSKQYIPEAHLGLGKIAIREDRLSDAENYFRKVIETNSASEEIKVESTFLLAKTNMWKGNFSNSIDLLKEVNNNPKKEIVNDALEYSLLINTFKNDSTNLFSYFNSDYLVEKDEFNSALLEFRKLAENKDLFLLKDYAALRYVELLLALNNYQEAGIFLEEVSNRDEDHIYKDRFLFLLGSNYYYGLNNREKALLPLTRIFEEFPNSIYFNKAREIIAEINTGVENSL